MNPLIEHLEIEAAKTEVKLKKIKQKIWSLQKECNHLFIPDVGLMEPPLDEDDLLECSIKCDKCGLRDYNSWYCKQSPNHKCQYSISYDCCDFCGNPEERK